MILKTWITSIMKRWLPCRVGTVMGTWVEKGCYATPRCKSWSDPGASGFPECDCQMRTAGHQWSSINAHLITSHPLLKNLCSSSALSMTPGSSAHLSWARPAHLPHFSSWEPAPSSQLSFAARHEPLRLNCFYPQAPGLLQTFDILFPLLTPPAPYSLVIIWVPS